MRTQSIKLEADDISKIVQTDADSDRNGQISKQDLGVNKKFIPTLRAVVKALDDPTLEADDISRIVRTAAYFRSNGLATKQIFGVHKIFSSILRSVADKMDDPASLLNAAQAMEQQNYVVLMHKQNGIFRNQGPKDRVTYSTFNEEEFASMANELKPGQHIYIPVTLLALGRGGHGFCISVTAQQDGSFRLSIANSNGWGSMLGKRNMPAAFVNVSREDLTKYMDTLLSDAFWHKPSNISFGKWISAGRGIPLMNWLKNGSGSNASVSANYFGNTKLIQSGQKMMAPDCAIEARFAFLKTVLKESDYKFVKAACMDVLRQIGDELNKQKSNTILKKELARLSKRSRSALGGYVVAQH